MGSVSGLSAHSSAGCPSLSHRIIFIVSRVLGLDHGRCHASAPAFPIKVAFPAPDLLYFPVNFRINLSTSTHAPTLLGFCGDFTAAIDRLEGNGDMFTIFHLLVHGYDKSLFITTTLCSFFCRGIAHILFDLFLGI